MKAYEIPDIDPQPREADGHGYVDFLASEKLSVGSRSGRPAQSTASVHTKRTRSIT